MTVTPRQRDAFRILIVDDSGASRAAEQSLQDKNLSFVKQDVSEDTADCKPPCLIAGEGRFSGEQLIEGYAKTIDRRIKKQDQ